MSLLPKECAKIKPEIKVNCVRWVNNELFVTSSVDKTVVLWKDLVPVLKLTGHTESVTSVDAAFLNGDGGSRLNSAGSRPYLSYSFSQLGHKY